jgi:hypothetical protein
MAITKFTGVTNTIQSLSDRPNQNEGLTPAQLKQKFDQFAIDNKAYLNDILIVEVDTLNAQNVKLTGNQSIAGTKTFTSSPIVPMPTTEYQATPRKYVDDVASIVNSGLQAQINANVGDIGTLQVRATTSENNIVALGNTKTDKTGNHLGSWQGISSPSASEPGIQGVVDLHTTQLADMTKVIISDTAPILTNVVWVDTGNNAFTFPKFAYGSIGNNTSVIGYFDKKILSIQNNLKCYTSTADRTAGTNAIAGTCVIDGDNIKFVPTTYLPIAKIYCRLTKGVVFYNYTTSKNDLDFEFDTIGLLNSNFKEWDGTNLLPVHWTKTATNAGAVCSILNGEVNVKSGNVTTYSTLNLSQTLDMTRVFNGILAFNYKTLNTINTTGVIALEIIFYNASHVKQLTLDFYLNGAVPVDTVTVKSIDLKGEIQQNVLNTITKDLLALSNYYGFNFSNFKSMDFIISSNSASANILMDSYWSNINFGEVRI